MSHTEASTVTPLVSVIIPVYNQAGYVSRAVQSVLDQTLTEFELIIVDDGSTDNTPQVLAGFTDPRIRIIRQPNAGLSAARNRGLKESTAALVTFLDSDDYFLPTKLEIMCGYLNGHPDVGMVAGQFIYIDDDGNTLGQPAPAQTPLKLPELLLENPICVSGIVLRANWLEHVGTFDENLRACEDWDLWLRLAAAGCSMAWIDQPVVAYRIHPGQMTQQSSRMRKAILAMFDKFFSRPDLPEPIRACRDRAIAAGLVHASAYAYLSNECRQGAADLAEALRLDPSLAANQYRRLVDMLMGWSGDPRAQDAGVFLRRIISNPPDNQRGFARQLRRAAGDVMLARLFNGTRETWRDHRWDLLRAVMYKPDWLANRGVLRMLLDAWRPAF